MADPTRQQEYTSNSSAMTGDDGSSEPSKTPAVNDQSDEEVGIPWWMTLSMLMPIWVTVALVGTPVFGWGASAFIMSPAIILLLAGVITFTDVTTEVVLGLSMVCGFFLIAILIAVFARGILWYAVGIPFGSLVEYVTTVPYVAGTAVLGVVAVITSAVVYTVRKTETPIDWSLLMLMIACPIVLGAVLIGFFTAVWRVIEAIVLVGLGLLGIGTDAGLLVTGAVALGLISVFVYLELARLASTGRLENATVVTTKEAPTLHAVTTRVASQLDVPVPEIAVAKRPEPEAITRGYRPSSVTLIVSQGTLDALDEKHLEAVVAHELAHVASMDAIVMTIVSVPMFLSDRLGDQLRRWDPYENRSTHGSLRAWFVSAVRRRSPHRLVAYVLLLIALLTEYLSRPIVALLARTRESAADRTAATVTGSPAVLATALRTLDERIAETPSTDAREASRLSSLSILPLDPINTDPDTDDSAGFIGILVSLITGKRDQEATGVQRTIGKALLRIRWRLFATHPPTSRRLDTLAALEEKHEVT
jgi:heat shock protein HtpX